MRSRSKRKKVLGIKERREQGFNLFIKSDGTDYAAIWRSLMAGTLAGLTQIRQTANREVYHAAIEGREFLIKVDRKRPINLDMKLWRIIRGPEYSRRMIAVSEAIMRGCTATQEIFFVAEKTYGLLTPETYIILDYIPGHPIAECDEPSVYFEEAARTLSELHKYNLALGDVNIDNFLYTQDGVKVVDLSHDGLAWSGKGKDIVRTMEQFGVSVDANGLVEKVAVKYTLLKKALKKQLSAVKVYIKR